MVTQAQLTGDWNRIRGKVRERWGQVTEDDLRTFQGNVDQLVGLIQRKTGEGREAIESTLDSLMEQGTNRLEEARRYASEAAHGVQEAYENVSARVREGFVGAERVVQQNPASSVGIAFGAGLLAGVLVGLMLRSR
jgi:uncharacterized protein YjbJ (UPF0337 family)